MKRRPDLPPRMRGRIARRLTSAAARGRFELPVCEECGTVVFPVQEVCPNCLSDRLDWQRVSPKGKVLTHTRVHHSTDPYFDRIKPVAMGLVQLDVGPVVFARFGGECEAVGTRVRLFNLLDRSGEQVFVATQESVTREPNVIADPNREIEGRTVLITGATGGIGRELVKAFVEAGAARVYAAARKPDSGGDDIVRPLALDVTDAGSVRAAADAVGPEVDILINNAGVTAISGLLDANTIDGARSEIEVNYLGTLAVIRAFAPHMKDRGRGVILNVLTVLAHSCLPSMGSYCASKAAALSMTQGVRAELLPWGVRVAAIFPSTVDTEASAESPPPKLRPAQVAADIVTMIRDGIEDFYPGKVAQTLYEGWREDPKVVEREMSLALPEPR